MFQENSRANAGKRWPQTDKITAGFQGRIPGTGYALEPCLQRRLSQTACLDSGDLFEQFDRRYTDSLVEIGRGIESFFHN
jgi:hypothetical protein